VLTSFPRSLRGHCGVNRGVAMQVGARVAELSHKELRIVRKWAGERTPARNADRA